MMLMASLSFDPAMIAGWVFAGLAVGWLTGRMTEEASYGALGDLILGALGGIAGGVLYGYFRADSGFWGGVLVAVAAAGVLIAATRTVFALRGE
jgi:uncharacterized membrane protein YeaQ/YmgE (transglycosylase-associated protein family)